MLPLIVAALAATAQPVSPPTSPEASAVTVQSAPQSTLQSTRASRRNQIVCKAVIWQGIGAAQHVCATRAQWEARSAQERQNLVQFQLRSYSAGR